MYSALPSRRELLSVRHRAMAELLADEGYVVLLPDSFRSRGQEEICTIEARLRTITQVHRLRDAQGALAYLQQRADVAPDRIAVLGWSHGGSAVLAAENAKHPGGRALEGSSRRRRPIFARASRSTRAASTRCARGQATRWRRRSRSSSAPSTTGPRRSLASISPTRLAAAGEPVTITVYPDTYHGFDNPAAQGRMRSMCRTACIRAPA